MSVILRSSLRGFSRRRLICAVESAMRRAGVGRSELSLTVVGERAMRSANRRFFRRSGPTDVISISQVAGDRVPMPEPLLGDVIVSLDAARTQAKSCGHSLALELSILAVHGLLHNLGMDDRTPRDHRAMMAKTMKLLRRGA